jgi:hypothetical protein
MTDLTAVRPLVATPAYGAQCCVNYVTSLLELQRLCARYKVPIEFYFRQDSLITRARNDCVTHFLGTSCTHLLFIDADIGFRPVDALRLVSSGRDVVAGVYPIKHDDAGFPIDLEKVGTPDGRGLATADQAPTGFMCIARRVLETMPGPDWFDTLRVAGELLSEDYAFCHRWRALGGQVFVDTRSELSHQGAKVWTRDFGRALRCRH